MNLITLFLIVALLVAIWWLIRKRREDITVEPRKPQLRPRGSNTQFHAVSLQSSSKACKAATEMAGRRFLANAAPKLPLPDCDMLECNCRFAHHDDRRTHKDRRSPFSPGGSGSATGSFTSEQRDGSDRRK